MLASTLYHCLYGTRRCSSPSVISSVLVFTIPSILTSPLPPSITYRPLIPVHTDFDDTDRMRPILLTFIYCFGLFSASYSTHFDSPLGIILHPSSSTSLWVERFDALAFKPPNLHFLWTQPALTSASRIRLSPVARRLGPCLAVIVVQSLLSR